MKDVEEDGSLELQLYVSSLFFSLFFIHFYPLDIYFISFCHFLYLFIFRSDGTNFIVPKEDCVLYRRAVRGDVVTLTYDDLARRKTDAETHAHAGAHATHAHAGTQDFARGVSSKPIVFRIRDDLSWGDVIESIQKGTSSPPSLFAFLSSLFTYSTLHRWKTARGEEREEEEVQEVRKREDNEGSAGGPCEVKRIRSFGGGGVVPGLSTEALAT